MGGSAAASLFARYARLADDHDYEGWSDLFCPDALFAFGSEEVRGREEIRQWLADRFGALTAFHSIVNVHAVPETADRMAVSADFAFHRREGASWVLAMVGRYEDVVVRDDGVWRFLEHRIVVR